MIIPISGTTVDWNGFVTQTKRILGRSPTRSLDSANVPVGNVFSYLAALAEFQHKGTNPFDGVRNANRLLKAVSMTFLCDARPGIRELVRQETDLFVIVPDDAIGIFILSGTLFDLRDAIVECSNEKKAFELRTFMNSLWLVLGKAGLQDIFKPFSRQQNTDGTYSLV